jgi:hypothetical protein
MAGADLRFSMNVTSVVNIAIIIDVGECAGDAGALPACSQERA